MKKGYIYATLKVVSWVLIIAWMSVVVVDYFKVKNEKEPIFCIKNEIIEVDNGTTKICTGLGYKYYNVVNEDYIIKKFVPFWVDPKLDDVNE